MTKRILNCTTSDFAQMKPKELLEAIRSSEGRTMVSEIITECQPLLFSRNISNAELASAMGADIILLNTFDVGHPHINGIPECAPEDTIRVLKKLIGRPVGINLEPAVNPDSDTSIAWQPGRSATAENARKAVELGVDLILVTGNPGKHVVNEGIYEALRSIRQSVGDQVILAAGKMHASGSGEGGREILSLSDIQQFAQAGADIILMPAPGTVPGVTVPWAAERVDEIHRLGKLAMTSIGTSQEGADQDTIRRIALMCKECGTDIHHIGDTGISAGMADPENIMAYSIVIRGRQHTWFRMAASLNR